MINPFDLANVKTTQGVVINKLILTETGSYNPQFHRPYGANLNGLNIGLYNEITQGQATVRPEQLAGFAGNILQPMAEAQSSVFIPNDFSNRRCVFLMEVTTRTQHGSDITEIITGYTNHLGLSLQTKSIDPNMQFWINNSVTVRRINSGTQLGNQLFSTVTDASHVLIPPTVMGGAPSPLMGVGQMAGGLRTMTPADVVGEISKSSFPNAQVDDYRGMLSGTDVRKSKRINGVMAHYLSKTVTGINQAAMSADAVSTDPLGMFSNARDLIRESYLSNDAFLTFLSEYTSFKNFRCVTYGELCSVFPALDNVTKVSILGNAARNNLPMAGQTEYMSTATKETVIATILSNAVPALMMDLMITSLNMEATNETLDGSVFVRVDNILSFADVDMTQYIERFRYLMSTVVYPDISDCNQSAVTIRMNVDIMANSRIQISVNSGPYVDYTIPTFCDALFAPVITPNPMNLSTIANVVSCLTSMSAQGNFDAPPQNIFTGRGMI